jgi:hypothetical protein
MNTHFSIEFFIILNEEMTKAQDCSTPAAANKGMITTSNN